MGVSGLYVRYGSIIENHVKKMKIQTKNKLIFLTHHHSSLGYQGMKGGKSRKEDRDFLHA